MIGFATTASFVASLYQASIYASHSDGASGDEQLSIYFLVSVVSWSASIVVHLIAIGMYFIREIRRSKQVTSGAAMNDWILTAKGATTVTAVVLIFAVLKIDNIALLHSNLFDIGALSAPFAPNQLSGLRMFGLLSLTVYNVPAVVVQSLVSTYLRKWTIAVAAAFTVNIVSLAVGLLERALYVCVAGGGGSDTADSVVKLQPAEQAVQTRYGAGGSSAVAMASLPAPPPTTGGAGRSPKAFASPVTASIPVGHPTSPPTHTDVVVHEIGIDSGRNHAEGERDGAVVRADLA